MKLLASLLSVASVASLALFAGACAPSSSPTDDPQAQQEGDALSATARAYVTLRRDTRKCASPMCGGWFAKDVNKKNPTERYVSALDFSAAGLDDDSIDQVQGAPDGEVVLRAKLGPKEPAHQTQQLLVFEAYRGMPGLAPASGDSFYAVAARDSADSVRLTAPCNNLTAKKLNTTPVVDYTRTDVALPGFVDNAWLLERAESEGAIVVGTIAKGEKFPGGYEQVLTAHQVLLKLPETQGPCPQFKLAACPSGQVWTYTRTPDRCMMPDTCVDVHPCPLFLPACGESYTLQSWAAAPSGCPSYTCDPSWIYPEQ